MIQEASGSSNIFNPTEGFINSFKMRHGILELALQGEVLSATTETIGPFLEELKVLIECEGYCEDQIYNADETGINWKALPKTTLASLNENKASGFKVSKERATVLLCANSTGSHKLIPLFIGKYKNPRIFKNCKLHLPLIYKSNLSSWMTKTIFEEWFHKSFVPSVQEHLRSLNLPPKAMLLLDNAPVHCKNMISNDGQIKTKFLPQTHFNFAINGPKHYCIFQMYLQEIISQKYFAFLSRWRYNNQKDIKVYYKRLCR